jgi:hypothetical protein
LPLPGEIRLAPSTYLTHSFIFLKTVDGFGSIAKLFKLQFYIKSVLQIVNCFFVSIEGAHQSVCLRQKAHTRELPSLQDYAGAHQLVATPLYDLAIFLKVNW